MNKTYLEQLDAVHIKRSKKKSLLNPIMRFIRFVRDNCKYGLLGGCVPIVSSPMLLITKLGDSYLLGACFMFGVAIMILSLTALCLLTPLLAVLSHWSDYQKTPIEISEEKGVLAVKEAYQNGKISDDIMAQIIKE